MSNSPEPALQQVSIEIPQYSIMSDENGGFLALVIATGSTMTQTFLATPDTYRAVAGSMRDMILRAGAELAAKTPVRLIAATELPPGLRGRKT